MTQKDKGAFSAQRLLSVVGATITNLLGLVTSDQGYTHCDLCSKPLITEDAKRTGQCRDCWWSMQI